MSWKKYGGIDKYEKLTNIKAKSIVTDNIVVKDAFLSDFIVDGTMTVRDNTFLQKGLQVTENAKLNQNLDVSGSLYLGNQLFLTDLNTFIKGENYKIGINKLNPSSTIDIVSNNTVNSLNVSTNTIQNRNILARNNIDNGMAFFIDGSNASTLQFYNKAGSFDSSGIIIKDGITLDNAGSNTHAKMEYSNKSLKMTGTELEKMEIHTKLLVSDKTISHNFEETAVIYDSEHLDLYPNITKYSNAKYGNALSLYGDNSNNLTFLNMFTNNKGLYLGGGNYPIDTNKSMAILDLKGNERSIPGQIIIDGSENYATTFGFNTYEPNQDNLFNINGPTYVTNDIIHIIDTVDFEIINYIKNPDYPNIALACGNILPYITQTSGKNWTHGGIQEIGGTSYTFPAGRNIYDGYIVDTNKSILTTNGGGFIFYSPNLINYFPLGPQNFTIPNNEEYVGIHVYTSLGINNVFYAGQNPPILITFQFDWLQQPTSSIIISNGSINSSIMLNAIKMKGYDNFIYILKSQIIEKYEITSDINGIYVNFDNSYSIPHINNTITIAERYVELDVYDGNTALFKDSTYVHGTTNGGITWNSFDLRTIISTPLEPTDLLNISILDSHRGVVVGNSFFAYSTDGFINWRLVTQKMLKNSGLSYLLDNKRLSSVYMPDSDNFYLSDYDASQTIIKNLFSPSLINYQYSSVIETIGSIHTRGDVMINEGHLRSNNTKFDLLPDSHNIINIGPNTSEINIVNSSLIVDPSKVTIQTSETTNSFIKNLDVSENAIIKNLEISENLMVNSGQLDSSNSTFNLLTQTYDTINIGTDATTVNMGKDIIHIGDGYSSIYLNGNIKGELIVDGSFIVQSTLQQEGNLDVSGGLSVSRRSILDETIISTLEVSNNSLLNDVSMTNLEVSQNTQTQTLNVLGNSTFAGLTANNISYLNGGINIANLASITNQGIINGASLNVGSGQVSGGSSNFSSGFYTSCIINTLNSTTGNITNINSSGNAIMSKATITDASLTNVDVSNDIIVSGNLVCNNLIGSDDVTTPVQIYSDKNYLNVYIARDASNIQIGNANSNVTMSGSQSASDTTGELRVTTNAYFGYNNQSLPTGKLAFFNGDIEVVGANSEAHLPNVISTNITSTNLDATTAYIADKLYIGYTSNDSVPTNSSYFNGDLIINGSNMDFDTINGTISQW